MAEYVGQRTENGCVVVVIEDGKTRPLPKRLDLMNHSPTGFEWGYAGSGPAQLALAILADVLDDDRRAVRLHQKFKATYIQNLGRDVGAEWTIRDREVRLWAASMVGREQ